MKILCWLVFMLCSVSLFSQLDSTLKPVDLNELSLEELLDVDVYSASRKLQRQSEAPAIMTTITRAQIETLGAITMIDVLKYVPGLEATIGSDGFYRVSIRGIRKNGEILVLINGQQINDFYNGRAIFDLPVEFIEKIEVIRGPGSALYGSNAMAGVINIFTIRETSATVSGGNNGTIKANVNYFIEKKKTQFNVSVGALSTDGAGAIIDTDKVEVQSWSLTHMEKNFRASRWNKDAYLSSKLSSGDLHFQIFDMVRQQGSYVGPVFIAATGSKLLTNQLTSSLYYDFKIGENVIITPKVYGNLNYHDFLNQETPKNYVSTTSGNLFTNGKQSKETYLGKTYGTELDIYIKANEHFDLLTGSVFEDHAMANYELTRNYKIVGDQYKESFENYDHIPFDQKNKRRYVFAYFVQGNYKIKKFNFTGGLRYDDYNDFGSAINPRIGVNYKPNSHWILKGLYGKAFRAPTFQELYDNTTLGNEYGVKGNLNLTPEKINSYELGTEITYSKVVLKYNVFYLQTNNLIQIYDPHGGGSVGSYENIGNLSTYGNGVELVITIMPKVYLFANYSQFVSNFTWNKDKVRKADVAFYEKQPDDLKNITNIPTLRLNLGVEATIKKFHAFVGANYGNEAYNNSRFYLEQDHFVNIPFYLQGNFNFGYSITSKCKVSIIGQNIGEKYSDPDESTNINAFGSKGLKQPGASFMLQVKYKL
ncbi:MAG: TonB-dependent receptor [Bacteroidota bacterium]